MDACVLKQQVGKCNITVTQWSGEECFHYKTTSLFDLIFGGKKIESIKNNWL